MTKDSNPDRFDAPAGGEGADVGDRLSQDLQSGADGDEGDDGEDDATATPGEDSLTLDDLRGASDLVEIYRADSDIAASVVMDEILGPAGIRAYRHDRRSHALPAPASMPGEIGIAVSMARADEARTLLREALRDGVLPADGDGGMTDEEDDTGVA